MASLETLLERTTPMLRGIARYYHRRSWGLHILDYTDYFQEAHLAAVSVYRCHRLPLYRLIPMVNRAAIYRCQRLWRKELFKVTSQVELSEILAEPLSSSFAMYFTRETVAKIRETLTGLRRQMFDVLISPETCDMDYLLCYEMYRENPHRPIQRGELCYLATYFSLSRRMVQRELAGLRHDVATIFEGGLG